MTAPDVTRYVIIINVVLLALFDVYQRLVHGSDATLSVVLCEAAHDHPVIAYVVGFLSAHVFWQVRD